MPLFTTGTQFVALAMVLVAGWLFGLASHPGGRKWRDRYATERDAHAGSRRAAEQRYAADAARIAQLERDNASLAAVAPVAATSIVRPVARVRAIPAATGARQREWFDWN